MNGQWRKRGRVPLGGINTQGSMAQNNPLIPI